MTSLKLLEEFPFTSADSTSWIMTAVNGSIFTKYGPVLVSNHPKSLQNKQHFNFLDQAAKDSVLAYINDKGFKMEELAVDYKQREFFNITYMNDWAANYEYKGGDRRIRGLFEL